MLHCEISRRSPESKSSPTYKVGYAGINYTKLCTQSKGGGFFILRTRILVRILQLSIKLFTTQRVLQTSLNCSFTSNAKIQTAYFDAEIVVDNDILDT